MKFLLLSKIVTRTVGTTLACLFVFSILFSVFYIRSFLETLDKEFSRTVEVAQSSIKENYLLGDLVLLRRSLDLQAGVEGWMNGEFFDENGDQIWQFEEKTGARGGLFLGSVVINIYSHFEDLKRSDSGALMLQKQVDIILEGGERIGTFRVSIDVSRRWYKFAKQILLMVVMLSSLSIVFGIVQFLVTKTTLAPLQLVLQDLQNEATKISLSLEENDKIDELTKIKLWFAQLKEMWQKASTEAAEKAKLAALGQQASQIAHDIRSPLFAFQILIEDFQRMPEDRRILAQNAIARINDIANSLLRQVKNQKLNLKEEQRPEETFLHPLINYVIGEKRLQIKKTNNISIVFENSVVGCGCFATVNPTGMARILSNLIENSIEAKATKIKIYLSEEFEDGFVRVNIKDNGIGIPTELVKKLGNSQVSFGKNEISGSGTGIGLFSAKNEILSWGGSLSIESDQGIGTLICLKVRKANAPKWFCSKIDLTGLETVIVVDDDKPVHYLWNKRFEKYLASGSMKQVVHYFSLDEFQASYKEKFDKSDFSKTLILCDFEFAGTKLNGLELLSIMGLNAYSILVTSKFDDKEIQDIAVKKGIKILPKQISAEVGIEGKFHQENMSIN